MNKWARPLEWNSASAAPAGGRSAPPAQLYFAFLSYSHHDAADADWLHRELERFRVPSGLVGRLTENGVVPRRLTPIFRDRHELAAADDLGEEIREALSGSRCLIVLCSPAAAKSKWTNAEIASFKQLNPHGCVIAAIVGGEPFASDIAGREQEECLPPALRQKYDRRGRPTGKRAEPLAADLREGHGGRRLGFLKIVAGMLGLGLDDLVQREQLRRQRRLAGITAGSLVGMLVATGLAVTAIQARDEARDQRREAEGLVAFMLGDLKDKLEPVGRLDVLDGVGSRVLQYYGSQDTSELSDSALLQRSRALSLMAEVATARGDMNGALRLYHKAMEGTAEAVRRDSEDPQRLFDHAQNVFYVAQIARNRGDSGTTERVLREYKRLAGQMVALEPDNMKWRMEAQYADYNLGVVLYDRRQFAESSTLFQQALETIEALATADPKNSQYQKELSEALTWLADARLAMGRIDDAIALRERHVSLLERLLAKGGNDVEYRQKLVLGYQRLGNVYAARGLNKPAEQNLRAAVRESGRLMPVDVNNSKWREHGARVRLRLSEYLLATGNLTEAGPLAQAGCATIGHLVEQDRAIAQRRAIYRDCLLVRVRLALANGMRHQAIALAARAVEAAKAVDSSDRIADAYAIAEAHRLLGDVRQRIGDTQGARVAWQAGMGALPSNARERPPETAERSELLARLGDRRASERLKAGLAAMGIRRTDVLRV